MEKRVKWSCIYVIWRTFWVCAAWECQGREWIQSIEINAVSSGGQVLGSRLVVLVKVGFHELEITEVSVVQ